MPYVKADTRESVLEAGPLNVGELTYAIQQAVRAYLCDKCDLGDIDSTLHYADVMEVIAALEGAKADIIRRLLTPLEERAQAQNGDVWDSRILRAVGADGAR